MTSAMVGRRRESLAAPHELTVGWMSVVRLGVTPSPYPCHIILRAAYQCSQKIYFLRTLVRGSFVGRLSWVGSRLSRRCEWCTVVLRSDRLWQRIRRLADPPTHDGRQPTHDNRVVESSSRRVVTGWTFPIFSELTWRKSPDLREGIR